MLVIVIIMLIIQCTIKCCNVKLQVVYDNITHAMLYNYITIKFQCALYCKIVESDSIHNHVNEVSLGVSMGFGKY